MSDYGAAGVTLWGDIGVTLCAVGATNVRVGSGRCDIMGRYRCEIMCGRGDKCEIGGRQM